MTPRERQILSNTERAAKPEESHGNERVLIVYDGVSWFARHVACIEHRQRERDEMIYHCDFSIGGPYGSADDALEALERLGWMKFT